MKFSHVTPGMVQKLFYTEAPWYVKLFHIYILGDMIVLLPFLLIVTMVGFLTSWPYAFLMGCIFHAVRQLGEMIYWLLQQFGEHTYRPSDFGFTKLSTHSLYIVYQVHACVQTVIGLVAAIFVYTEYILH